ncbi:hypothetical protein F444_09870 [Phytophthora nicotianae P1976]|uniref:Uncharacterized protein n=1 Tax=Phytophthora nicotianae P1976 TaxID=1317066 RepID=A0A081A668_PHYNI|nr:hypothetical protein F444_09870 [Phytophthora nicotianae P1976]
MLGRTRAGGDYDQPVSSNDVEELEAMMSKWEGFVSASDYVVVDDDVDVHEPDVIIDDEAEKEEEEEEESKETVIQPAIVLRHCLELSSFLLQRGAQTDSERRALSTVTALVWETTLKANQQKTMGDLVM